jgi:sulfite reductase beta subunit-like hemoprotein
MTAPTPSIDYAALKSGGIMQKDDDFFALRLRLPGGCIASELLPKIVQVARRHGRGEVRLTARARIEIPWIKLSGEVWQIVVKK